MIIKEINVTDFQLEITLIPFLRGGLDGWNVEVLGSFHKTVDKNREPQRQCDPYIKSISKLFILKLVFTLKVVLM